MSTAQPVNRPSARPVNREVTDPDVSPESAQSQPLRLWRQLLVASVFWMLCLTLTAAGHRLYKATVAVDRTVSAETYTAAGSPLVWVGHGSLEQVRQRVVADGSLPTAQLHALPNSRFWLAAGAGFTLLAALMAWSGRWVADSGFQSLIGLFAGHFLWLGAIELGLDAAGRRLGLAGSLDVVGDQVVGTHSAGMLIQLSGVFLVPVLIGLTLHESNRCVLFQWFRRRLPIVKTPAASGRVENYAARTTMQYFMTVWFCYVGVLWLADPRLGQVGEMALLGTMLGIFAATPYMIWRTTRQPSRAQALRYSVSGAVVTWTAIEIAAALRYFEEPWLSHSLSSGAVLLGLSLLLTAWTLLLLTASRSGMTARVSPGLTMLLVGLMTAGTVGCGQPEVPESLTAEQVRQQLIEYDQQIPQPTSEVRDGLLHALTSPDPAVRAQAAIALGKSRGISSAAKVQLESMAKSEDSRLSQFAALTALSQLGSLSPQLQSLVTDLQNDPEWASVVDPLVP